MSRFSRILGRPWCRRILAAAALGIAGVAISPVGTPARDWQRENQPALQSAELEGVVGQGVLLGMFGGLRAVMADFVWVRSYVLWERRERAECETAMRLAIALDPKNDYFWRQSASVIAGEFPIWICRERAGNDWRRKLEPGVQKIVFREQAERAITMLDTASKRMPEFGGYYTDAALIVRNKLNDNARAAEYFRRAAELRKPVWFAGISYVNILFYDSGKKAEALAWYRDYLARLEAGKFGTGGQIPDLIKLTKERLAELEKEAAGA